MGKIMGSTRFSFTGEAEVIDNPLLVEWAQFLKKILIVLYVTDVPERVHLRGVLMTAITYTFY